MRRTVPSRSSPDACFSVATQIAVGALTYVANSHVELREQRLTALGLSRLTEREALQLLWRSAIQQTGFPSTSGTCPRCRTQGPTD